MTALRNKNIVIVIMIIFIIILLLIIQVISGSQTTSIVTENTTDTSTPEKFQDTQNQPLDYTKLPLGDEMYSTEPKLGYVFSCNTSYNGGGAFQQGPWINTTSNTWDLTKKISVDGKVNWSEAYWNTLTSGEMRIIKSANLPYGHFTGIFPISANDEAYQYDRNPNAIEEQTISFEVPKNPTLLSTPKCIGGEVGIATTGVLIFNAFDAGGRDAVATEIQDECEGHPQAGSYYHYHGYSSCLEDNTEENEHSQLLGYAFDGFGIYGIKGVEGKELSSNDLDLCHGHIHEIEWDGKTKEMFHYHFTQDFPYTVACFRGEPSVQGLSTGEGMSDGQQRNLH